MTKKPEEITWKDVKPGAIVCEPGSTMEYKTGDWRSQVPRWNFELCNKCKLCATFCPEGCVGIIEDDYYAADLFWCKGCGICATECPKKAITMDEEGE